LNPKGYSISDLKSGYNPRAMTKEEWKALLSFDCPDEYRVSFNLFLFSYYCLGMNYTDIANLTQDNLHGDRLIYQRQKTGKVYNMKLHPKAQEIIKASSSDSSYLFPVLSELHQTSQQKMDRIAKKRKQINKDLRNIPSKYYTGAEKTVGHVISHKQSLKNKFRANLIRQ
jgi:hypothetical protein